MQSKTCPTCNGSGVVWTSVRFSSAKPGDRRWDNAGKTCSCNDEPQHGYSPGWCPDEGPV